MTSGTRSATAAATALAVVAAVVSADEAQSPAYGYKIAHATYLAGGSDAFVVKLVPGK